MSVPATISLNIDEILYDIRNKAFLTGRSREAETSKTFEAASNIQASEDEEDLNQMLRSISTHYGTIKVVLAEYLNLTVHSSSNELITTNTRLDLSLSMPSNFNLSAIEGISAHCHQYIVAMSLADWFTIADKADVKEYLDAAASHLDGLKRAVCKRVRPTRPTAEK